MKKFRSLFRFAHPYRKYLFGSIIFNILYSALSIFSVITMLPILKILFKLDTSTPIPVQPVYSGDISTFFDYAKNMLYYSIQQKMQTIGAENVLLWLCIITGFAFLVRNLFRYFGSYLMVNYRVGVTKDLRSLIYHKFLELPAAFFTEQRKGDMMSRISNDVGAVEGNIMATFVDVINAPFMIIASLATLFFLDARLTLFTLIIFPIMGFLISFVGKSLKKQATRAQEELGNLFSLVEETLKSNKIIKIFNADIILKKRFQSTTDYWAQQSLEMSRRRELASPVSEFLGSITILLLTWFAGVNIIRGYNDDPATFLAFIGVFYQILDPAKKISGAYTSIQSGLASWVRLEEVLHYEIKIFEPEDAKEISTFTNNIEFKNVGFQYENDVKAPVLKNFNLHIEKGKTVALVGQSGSGKTTVANLLARFYDPTDGSIFMDGEDIRHYKVKSYRSQIGMVTQDSVLFNDTISNNILMGKPDASMDEIIAAAKIANAHDFILELPQGYNTNIGDDGGRISGGQKQRISIARAVLKNPPIMILDEATSALDTQSEKLVQDALEKMMASRTSLVIAHRLSTIQKAHLILVMEKGKIVEQGTHEELLAKKGQYSKLVDLQNFS